MMARGWIAAGLLAGIHVAAGAAAPDYAEVAAILQSRCVMCHSGDAAPLGLRLDSLDGIKAGSRNGPVARADDAPGSELMRRLRGDSQPRMPMTGPPWLSADETDLIERWIAADMPAADPSAGATALPPPRPGPGETVTYAHVAPIFATRCAKCHTDNGLMGPPPEGYRLTSYESTVSAADRVRVVPGAPGASELLRRVRGLSRPRMPFDGPPWLDDEDITLIERWIAGGARGADGTPAPLPIGARLRFEGRLTGQWAVDGQPFRVDGGTRIDKRPRVGDQVELRARIGTDGSIEATRLRRR
ncbi:MAG: hypothetical protein KDF95_11200 [Rhodocyclaceae bacterium]|nr:hypothetical protein [Rhodocyclaceae bacterium]